MTTSGSTNYTITAAEIIRQALLNLRVIDPSLTTPTQDSADALIALNLMIKSWQLDGVFMWLNQEVCLHTAYGQQYYKLGDATTDDNWGLLSDCFKTQIAAAGSTGDLTITVDDDDDISNADKIGIELDDGTIQWTTVNGAPAANVVTITAALTDDVALDNWVFTYTNRVARPTMILEARVRDTDDVDTPLHIVSSYNEFMSITDKTSEGRVLDICYVPRHTSGYLYTWPVAGATDITDRIVMTIQRTIEDFDLTTEHFDGPVEGLGACIWGLAAWLAPQYGVDLTSGKGLTILNNAAAHYSKLRAKYVDREPFYFKPRR